MIDLASIQKQCQEFAMPQICRMFIILYNVYGPQGWWPGESPIEICLGAILTQNTNWKNVEKAITALKAAGLLSAEKLYKMDGKKLAEYLRPSGYYKQKTKTVRNFLTFLFMQYKGDLQQMLEKDSEILRKQLLDIKGIGPETADSILLYAGNKPVFVVDAYTKRLVIRHNFVRKNANYQELQAFFTKNLPQDVAIYNEYHALIVKVVKTLCLRKDPKCRVCPLLNYL